MQNPVIFEEKSNLQLNLLLLPVALIVAVGLGVIFGFLSQYNPNNDTLITIIFIMLMMFPNVMLAHQIVKYRDDRRSLLRAVISLLLCLLTYGVYRYTNYLVAVKDLPLTPTFWEYINNMVDEGIIVEHRRQRLNQGIDVWITWGIDLAIIISIGAWGGYVDKKTLRPPQNNN